MPDGKTLILGIMDGTVRVWDVASATEQPRIKNVDPPPQSGFPRSDSSHKKF